MNDAFTLVQELAKITDLDDKADSALFQAVLMVVRTEAQLLEAAASVRDTADRVERYVRTGQSVNSLGELQSRGLAFDRLCAERQQAIKSLMILADALGVRDEVSGVLDTLHEGV